MVGQGINAIIFYAPVLFEGIAGGSKGALLNTVVVNLGECSALLAVLLHPTNHSFSDR